MLKIKYICFGEETGYGVAAAGLISALRELGVYVAVTALLPGKVPEGGILLSTESSTDEQYDVVILHTIPEYYSFWYRREKQLNPQVKIWGYTAWETNMLPASWPALLNSMDGIFIPSIWNREVLQACGVTVPVLILPHVSEFEGQAPGQFTVSGQLKQVLDAVEGKFLFYSVNVWNTRKAPWRLVEAFSDEFRNTEDVALILKTGQQDWTRQERSWRTGFRKRFGSAANAFRKLGIAGENIYHVDTALSPGEIAALHNRGDCFVSFSRGEGWGMGAYEAAWFGTPVAATGQGGSVDFLPAEHAYLLPYDLIPVQTEFGRSSYSQNQCWAEVRIPEARQTLRSIFENQQAAKQKGVELKNHVREKFDRLTIAANLIEQLKNG